MSRTNTPLAAGPPKRANLPPYPNGWYAIGRSSEVGPGQVETRTFAGHEIVVFRTESGQLSVLDAYCPHLGAHMGHGGCVKAETIECPFHAFRFGTDGECVATGYGTKPPPRSNVRAWTLLERNGLMLVWHHIDGDAPTWEPPSLDWDDWTPLKSHQLRVKSHPQETTENSVDTGHLSVVHGYEAVDILDPVKIDGAHLTSRYTMTRKNPFTPWAAPIVAQFRVHVWGLGYSQVSIDIQNYGFKFRLFILPMPRDGKEIDLRVMVAAHKSSCRPGAVSPVLAALPASLFHEILVRQTLNGVVGDVRQDFAMWENKIYVDRPRLAKGDGPVGPYRRYCRQFYSEQALDELSSDAEDAPSATRRA